MNQQKKLAIQHFISRGILDAKEVKKIFKQSKERFPNEYEGTSRSMGLCSMAGLSARHFI